MANLWLFCQQPLSRKWFIPMNHENTVVSSTMKSDAPGNNDRLIIKVNKRVVADRMTDHPSLGNAPDPGVSATACEVGGLLIPSLSPALAALLSPYPDCTATPPTSDQMRPAAATKSSIAAEAFLPRSKAEGEGWLQSLLASWWEGGVEGVLRSSESPLCVKLLKLWRLSWSLYPSLYPHLRLSNQQLVQQFSSSHSWQEAPIR